MYLVTNRHLNTRSKTLKLFGDRPNELGPNELRIVEVTRNGRSYRAQVQGDKLSLETKKRLKQRFKLDIDVRDDHYASLRVACELFERAHNERKHLLLYIHGYNNDVKDVVRAAEAIEKLYDVIVVPFTWPANGGGPVSGSAAYLSDKKDARASGDALNSFVAKIHHYHGLVTAARGRMLWDKATRAHTDNPQDRRAEYSRLLDEECHVRMSMLCHSMGNYVLKHSLRTGDAPTRRLVFDNVCLVAADVNNEGHATWAGKIDVRNRLYIVINEEDFALKWSRRKPGDEQKARLGHYLRKLTASNAHYVDVTGAEKLGSDHTYFKGDSAKNLIVRDLFSHLFTGQSAEDLLEYRADLNAYQFPQ